MLRQLAALECLLHFQQAAEDPHAACANVLGGLKQVDHHDGGAADGDAGAAAADAVLKDETVLRCAADQLRRAKKNIRRGLAVGDLLTADHSVEGAVQPRKAQAAQHKRFLSAAGNGCRL